jgi:hypothetical protein
MYKVTDSEIEDIIDTAGYGINYWCVRAVVDSDARTYTVTQDPELAEPGDEPIVLEYDSIVKVAEHIANGHFEVGQHIRDYFVEWLDALKADDEDSQWAGGFIDSDAGDVLIQVACFAEIVYG